MFFLFFLVALHACSGSQKAAVQQENADAAAIAAKDTRLIREQGINFSATGSQPVNWRLQMNYDDTVKFIADDGLTLSFAYHRLKKNINNESTVLTAELPAGRISIDITDKICTVPTMRETFTKQVTVTFNGNKYSGCGKLLAEAMLNNTWVLEKMGAKVISNQDYGKIPVFNIDSRVGSITGNDGCSNINAKIEVQGNRIQFSPVATSRKTCSKKDISKAIAENISGKLIYYFFKDGKLYFSLPDDSIWIFKKSL